MYSTQGRNIQENIHPTTQKTLGIKSCVALGPAVACTAVVEQMKENFSLDWWWKLWAWCFGMEFDEFGVNQLVTRMSSSLVN